MLHTVRVILSPWKNFEFLENLRFQPGRTLGIEVRGDVIFSRSGDDCVVIFCPVIPHPHGLDYSCPYVMTRISSIESFLDLSLH